jgi:hypothetical protein
MSCKVIDGAGKFVDTVEKYEGDGKDIHSTGMCLLYDQ